MHVDHATRRVTEHWVTRDGTRLLWYCIESRHLWNIARMLCWFTQLVRKAWLSDAWTSGAVFLAPRLLLARKCAT